ncbi:MAG: DNA primase [Akkermansiaceae bacterium]|nr:DNA primase [Akkermansiaceae bacterium]
MGRIDEDSIRRVLEATDIVDVVGSYLSLKRAGSRWKACCPFHNEKTPSFIVDQTRQNFKCFGCGEGGSAITFVMKMENLGFADTVRRLAEKAGITLVEEVYDAAEEKRRKARTALLVAHKKAADFFHKLLLRSPKAAEARAYLNSRGYGAEMAKRWQVGWAPDSSREFLAWARKEGIADQVLIDSGLANRGERGDIYARFRDRLMFPINNVYGECVAFSGRILRSQENAGKYVNSPETAIFKKGDVVFALDKARGPMGKSGKALLCEGQIDVIACHEAGLSFAVAPLGTAFTPEHARTLSRYASQIVLCFDADKAGMAAADRAFRELAPLGKDVYLVNLPPGDDPDSFMKREGRESFTAMVEQARPFFEVRLERAKSQGLLEDAGASASFARDMTALLACMSDPVARDLATTDLATRMRMTIGNLRSAVKTAGRRKEREQVRAADRTGEAAGNAPEELPPVKMNRAVAVLCELALQNAQAQELIVDRIEELLEPMRLLPGGGILKKILARMPNPDNPASIHAFLESLPQPEKDALGMLSLDPMPIADVSRCVQEACSGIAKAALEKHIASLMAEIADPSTDAARRVELSKLSVDLKRLLGTM